MSLDASVLGVGLKKHFNSKDVCKRGHPRTPENVDSNRNCRICVKIRSDRYEASSETLLKRKLWHEKSRDKYSWLTAKVRYQRGGVWVIA